MARSDVLVSVDWAEENLNAPGVVFVEVDEDTSAYEGGHIEGAVRLDWKTDLQDQVRRDFVNQEQFSDLLSARGIGNDDTVVLYGGNNNWFAAYAYWYFKLYGHNDVKLLDGGRKKWELDGRPLSRTRSPRPATQYKAAGPGPDASARSATRSSPPSAPRTWSTCARPDEFSGKILAPAHLPQEQASAPATSRPRSTCRGAPPRTRTAPSSPTTTWPSCTRTKGLDDDKETIAYCRIGERSSHTWFVLQELLGHRTSRTTTAAGSNTAPSSAHRSSWERRSHMCEHLPRVRPSGRRRRREGNGHHRPCPAPPTASPSAAHSCVCSTAPVNSPPRSSPPAPVISVSSPPPGSWTVRALSSSGNGSADDQPRGRGHPRRGCRGREVSELTTVLVVPVRELPGPFL